MQLTRIVLHARLKGGELLHPAGSGGDLWVRIAVSLYCLQTLLSTGGSAIVETTAAVVVCSMPTCRRLKPIPLCIQVHTPLKEPPPALAAGMSVFGKLASQDGIGFFELTFFRNLATLLLTIPVLVAGHVNPLQHKARPDCHVPAAAAVVADAAAPPCCHMH